MSSEPLADPILEPSDIARARQIEQRMALLIPVLLALFVLSALHTHPQPSVAGRGLVVLIGTAGFGTAAVASLRLARRSRPLDLALGAVLAACAVAMIWAQPRGPGAVALFSFVVFRVRVLPAPVAVGVSGVTLAVLFTIAALTGRGSANPVVLAALGGFYGMSFLAVRLEAANDRAEQLVAQLERSRAAEARAAALAERQRLAREMHDVLAHSLSGLMIQLDGARILSSEKSADPRLSEIIQRAHHLGRSGVDEARRAIAALRGDELPGPERLPALVAQFEQDHAIPCRLTVTGAEHELCAEARLALYRVAQEALTNVIKHSRAKRVELRLDYEPASARLTVENFASVNGGRRSPDHASVPGGYGLNGMRERAELIGGSLSAGPTRTGFCVELRVPR